MACVPCMVKIPKTTIWLNQIHLLVEGLEISHDSPAIFEMHLLICMYFEPGGMFARFLHLIQVLVPLVCDAEVSSLVLLGHPCAFSAAWPKTLLLLPSGHRGGTKCTFPTHIPLAHIPSVHYDRPREDFRLSIRPIASLRR